MDDSSPRGKRRALGRGLDALLPVADRSGARDVDIDRIEPNPTQPRQRFDRAMLEDLTASIKGHGIVQPLVVSAIADGRYRLIVGERRWRAARAAGLRQVPVVVRETSERDTLELALIENVQRADLNPLEEAAAYTRLMQEFGLSQAEVAAQVGKSRVTIANTIRLLALPETLKRAIVEERITEGHARALLALTGVNDQIAALDRVEREGLTVRQTEELVRRLLGGQPRRRPEPAKAPDVVAVEDDLRRALGARVTLRQGRKGGRIVIEYSTSEQLDGLYRRLIGSE